MLLDIQKVMNGNLFNSRYGQFDPNTTDVSGISFDAGLRRFSNKTCES